ncbi:MAG: phytoene/squalene synthase family protein [Paracoccaceae bacterium]
MTEHSPTALGDMAHCKAAIKHGSHSFYAASHLLPAAVRDPALALYAFCRLADDEVDLKADKIRAAADLMNRVDLVYKGAPRNTPTDRAFAQMVDAVDMPRTLPEALLEGLAWDAQERRYETLDDLYAYAARVASAVGAMMCVIMKAHEPHVIARACDLGVAMQLTNMARDIGEDALEGRLYIPLDWLDEAGIDPEAFLAQPTPRMAIKRAAQRMLTAADGLYSKSNSGIAHLPLRCRGGVYAARYIYAAIGTDIARSDYDSVTRRARTTRRQKLGLLGRSTLHTALSAVMPRSAMVYAPPLPQTQFLVDAVKEQHTTTPDWSDHFISIMSQLKSQDALNMRP